MRCLAPIIVVALLASVAPAQTRPAPLRVSPAAQAQADLVVRAVAARDLPARTATAARPGLDEVVKRLRANQTAAARERWVQVVPVTGLRAEADVDALIQWVLRESYLETNEELKSYADKVRYYNDAKQAVREVLNSARAGQAVKGVSLVPYRSGGPAVRTEAPRVLTKAEQGAYIKTFEEKLASLGDDAQLANVDLQNVLQKQQQALQALSNVSKMLHDTAMAIIRKIGS